MSHLETELHGHVLVVTMNRPEAKNAFSPEMLVGMADAWDRIDATRRSACAVLTGAGGVFCAGADLKAMNDSQNAESDAAQPMREDAGLAWKALLRHHRLTKPLVAAVEGYAVAGGTEILQATDIRVAGESAVFGVVEVTRALFPLGGSTVRLRRQIPYTKAMELLLTGDTVGAAEAERIGLIGRVVPDGKALDTALEIGAADRPQRPARRPGDQAVRTGDRGAAGGRGPEDRARDRATDLRHRRRQGRHPGVQGEARAELPRRVTE